MTDVPKQESLFLELGDIIRIKAPTNENINEHTFFIDYLDEEGNTVTIDIIDDSTLTKQTIEVIDGEFTDESIEGVELLSRAKEKGYARQNNLIPGYWITLRFGGELPTIINGKITGLEEDMIEITTFPDNKKIYIDFAFKGIPKNIPLESIQPFVPPETEKKALPTKDDEIINLQVTPSPEKDEDGDQDGEDIEIDVQVHTPYVRERLKKILLDADDIQFGEELEAITEYIPVTESEKRFGIETQANDLLDEMLSTIPSADRTRRVLNQIHIMIERFKQLRTTFSVISPEGEIIKANVKGSNYKPLVERLTTFNKNLYWLLPIMKNKKKLYDVEIDDEEDDTDIIQLTLKGSQDAIAEIIEQYKNNDVPDGRNKYDYLFQSLHPYLTPFAQPTNFTNVIAERAVESNIDSVVDNLENFYSSIVENERVNRTRFVIEKYNLGLNKLYKNESEKQLPAQIVPLTQNDQCAITGILTLKEPALRYSHINLPNTSILMKSHLSLVTFNYWSILKQNTDIQEHHIASEQGEGEGIESNFLNEIEAFLFKETVSFNDRIGDNTYQHFLNKVIPQTRKLFEFVKKYIKYNTSYLSIIEYLEPFMIYPDDISFKQYEAILMFMREKITELRKRTVSNEIKYNNYLQFNPRTAGSMENKLVEMFKSGDNKEQSSTSEKAIVENIVQSYDISHLSTSASIRKLMITDNSRLFTSGISLLDTDLFQPINVDRIIQEALSPSDGPPDFDRASHVDASQQSKQCKKYTLAKRYIDIDELRGDDGINDLEFDKKYDTTRYDIANGLAVQKSQLSSSDFNLFLMNHLIHSVGLSPKEAERDARSMIAGKRVVEEGDYAYILNDAHSYIYFVRNINHQWVRDENLDGKDINAVMFCNLKKECIQLKKQCRNMDINKKNIQKELLKEILSQFQEKFHISIEQLRRTLKTSYIYNSGNINRLHYVHTRDKNKWDEQKFKLAHTLDATDVRESRFTLLRNLVLSQNDFVKKQADIIQFVQKTCRPHSPTNPNENEFWYYCLESDIPLLPTFYKILADAFYIGTYNNVLDQIVAQRGKLSDDGDKVVDKHSGFIIRTIDYDESEGYNEAGFKIVSRSILEADIENTIAELEFKIPEGIETHNSKVIINIIQTMDVNMGIHIDSQFEFILSVVNHMLDTHLPSKKDYEAVVKSQRQRMKKKKKYSSYEDTYNEALLLATLGTYLIAIQTMMPSIRTNRTFPGCIRSFRGYPLEGEGDSSALQYIACVALKLRSKTKPWDRLPYLKKHKDREVIERVVSKLKGIINSQLLENEEVKNRIADKLLYLSKEVDKTEISAEFDVTHWLTFLPPLKPIKVTGLHNIPSNFNSDLEKLFKTGNPIQFEKLSLLSSKIFYFSLHIQELIQRVVNKKSVLLFNINHNPFVENSCCNDGSKGTLQYFIDSEPNIVKYNLNVVDLEAIFHYALHLFKSPYIFDPRDTKLKFPPISKQFSEVTIYKAFIKFCAFNTGTTLTETFAGICGASNTSAFSKTDNIHEKIRILKQEGHLYSLDSFYQLLNLVNIQNIVLMDFKPVIQSSRLVVEQLIHNKQLQKSISDTPLSRIITLLRDIFDSYESTRDKNDERITAAVTFLDEQNRILMNERVIPFLSRYGIDNKYITFIRNIEKFKTRGTDIYLSREDETAFAEYEFLKTVIFNLVKVYPSIIINEESYRNTTIPKHWNLKSDIHTKDIGTIISQEFNPLIPFYSNAGLKELLAGVIQTSDTLLHIMSATPFYANIKQKAGEERSNTLLNGPLLEKFMKFYFLYSLDLFIIETEEQIESNEPKMVSFKKPNTDIIEQLNTELIQERSLAEATEQSIRVGREDEFKAQVASLIGAFMEITMKNKKIINFSDSEFKISVLKAKEREKSKITTRLGELTTEELQVEDILKNQRIGRWNLGQTRALFEYDADQYEKERKEIDEDSIRQLQLDGIDGVTSRTRDAFLLDFVEDQMAQDRQIAESNAVLSHLPEDDDFGDRDGDEGY